MRGFAHPDVGSPFSLLPMAHGVLGRIRGRLLGGAAGIGLPAAVFAVSFGLGVGLPTEAQAQSSSFNGTQATTYTLTTGTNTQTFTFGPNTVIGPTAPGTPGVTGDTLTGWNVINEGQINGGGGSSRLGQGIYLNTAGGNSVTNSGTITQGVNLHAGGNVTNLASGTITGDSAYGNRSVQATNVTNAGLINGNIIFDGQVGLSESVTNQSGATITGNVSAGIYQFSPAIVTNAGAIGGGVYLGTLAGGTVINQSGATITNGATQSYGAVALGSYSTKAGGGTVTNAGTIAGTGGTSRRGGTSGIFIATGNIINLDSGIITSAAGNGVYILGPGASSVTNQAGGTITGATNGIATFVAASTITVTNAGAITGTAANGIYLTNGGNLSVTNQAGATITGGVDGIKTASSTAFLVATITNAGTIAGTSGAGVSLDVIATASITNLRGATISGTTGIYIFNLSPVTITNAGTITGTGGTAIDITRRAYSTLILQTGSVLNGTAIGASPGGGFGGRLLLQGTGIANNDFQQFSTVEVDASGIWTLNGVFTTVSGERAVINSGTLVIGDGSHPGAQLPGPMTINAGTTLGGQGTVGSIVVAPGGTVAPGIVSPFSTLNDTSNVQFDVTSFFNVIVNAAGQNDKLAAGGTATLTGGIVQVLAQPGDYAASTNYTILTAGTRNSTTFAGVTSSSIFVTPTLTYPTQQEVVLTLAGHPFSYVAATPNQLAVANALGAGPFGGLADAVFNQPTAAGAQQAFDALSGEIYGSLQNTLADETLFGRNAMLDRMRQGAYAGASGDMAALSFGGPALSYGDNLYDQTTSDPLVIASNDPLAAVTAAAEGSAAPTTAAAPAAHDWSHAPSRDLTYWGQALGGFGRADGNGNAATLNNAFGGFLTGFDVRFGAVRAGFMGGYTHSDVNVDAVSSSAGIDSAQLGAYAASSFGAFNLRSGVAGTFNAIDTSRMVAFPGFSENEHARFNGYTGQAFGELGYGMAFNHVAIEPFAGLAYVLVNTGGFQESGGVAALSGSSSTENIGYSSLGLRAATIWMLSNGTALVPHVSAQWQHAFGDVTPTVAVSFQSTGAGFSTAGLPIAANAAVTEAGIDWRITPRMKFGIAYQGELALNAQTHAGTGTFTWDF
ncbi:MAG: autotransporter domain-containing protein [Xanthobacteraceae bacterium]